MGRKVRLVGASAYTHGRFNTTIARRNRLADFGIEAFHGGTTHNQQSHGGGSTSQRVDATPTIDQSYGSGSSEAYFGGKAQALSPFRAASGLKSEGKMAPRAAIQEALRNPTLEKVDPRELTTPQSFVTKSGVDYYLTDKYRKTGETYADKTQAGNRFPMIWQKPNGRLMIMSGNHRATAAFIKGELLEAIVVRT